MKDTKEIVKELKEMKRRIDELLILCGYDPSSSLRDEENLKIVTYCMIELGIRADLKGYAYIRTAIEWAIEEPRVTHAMTKELYPDLAKKYETQASRVERAIRHAIEVGCDRGNPELYAEIFGYTISATKGKPTNSEFIARVADHIKLNMLNHKF